MAIEETTSQAVENNDNSGETKTFVVGEHSVYTSVQDLYNGAVQKEAFIDKLQKELAEAREQIENLSQRSDIVGQLKQIRENKMENTENTNPSQLPEDAIKQIALKAVQESKQADTAESNLANCKQAVASISDDVELALKNKAKELGCSVEYLEGIAKTTPKAFKSMFGLKEAPVTFDSINFLQSSRQTGTNTSSDEVDAFFKNTAAHRDPKQVAAFLDKVFKDPSLLDKHQW